MDLVSYFGWERVDWIHLAQYSDQCRALANEPSGSVKGGKFFD